MCPSITVFGEFVFRGHVLAGERALSRQEALEFAGTRPGAL